MFAFIYFHGLVCFLICFMCLTRVSVLLLVCFVPIISHWHYWHWHYYLCLVNLLDFLQLNAMLASPSNLSVHVVCGHLSPSWHFCYQVRSKDTLPHTWMSPQIYVCYAIYTRALSLCFKLMFWLTQEGVWKPEWSHILVWKCQVPSLYKRMDYYNGLA